MTQHVFTIYDSKAEAYLSPFTANTVGLAERMFSDMVNQPGHTFNLHPEDYTLYRIGTYDTSDAALSQTEYSVVINGLQAVPHGTQISMPGMESDT